jgi:hypothetical protein
MIFSVLSREICPRGRSGGDSEALGLCHSCCVVLHETFPNHRHLYKGMMATPSVPTRRKSAAGLKARSQALDGKKDGDRGSAGRASSWQCEAESRLWLLWQRAETVGG